MSSIVCNHHLRDLVDPNRVDDLDQHEPAHLAWFSWLFIRSTTEHRSSSPGHYLENSLHCYRLFVDASNTCPNHSNLFIISADLLNNSFLILNQYYGDNHYHRLKMIANFNHYWPCFWAILPGPTLLLLCTQFLMDDRTSSQSRSSLLYTWRSFIRYIATRWGSVTQMIQLMYLTCFSPSKNSIQLRGSLVDK